MEAVATFVTLNRVNFFNRLFVKKGRGEGQFESNWSTNVLLTLLRNHFHYYHHHTATTFWQALFLHFFDYLLDWFVLFSLPFRWDLFPIFLILRLELEDTSFSVNFLLFCCLNFLFTCCFFNVACSFSFFFLSCSIFLSSFSRVIYASPCSFSLIFVVCSVPVMTLPVNFI